MSTKPVLNEIKYLTLNSNDLGTFKKLNKVFAEAFEEHEPNVEKKPTDQYLKSLLSKEHFIAIAALNGEEVVGGLVAYFLEKYEQERSEMYLYDLAVDEKYRRQGIARQLIKELKAIAKALGSKLIFVQANREDAPAIKLYASMGSQEEPFQFIISLLD